ncbi:hypothetical protein TcWFU_003158 [Taenia crassiceps]|uniref:Uncharacterized protein n=1 Tax=Taenia crassiceps TaxID=6207 RepID=A0ABR4QLV7_9CEST
MTDHMEAQTGLSIASDLTIDRFQDDFFGANIESGTRVVQQVVTVVSASVIVRLSTRCQSCEDLLGVIETILLAMHSRHLRFHPSILSHSTKNASTSANLKMPIRKAAEALEKECGVTSISNFVEEPD